MWRHVPKISESTRTCEFALPGVGSIRLNGDTTRFYVIPWKQWKFAKAIRLYLSVSRVKGISQLTRGKRLELTSCWLVDAPVWIREWCPHFPSMYCTGQLDMTNAPDGTWMLLHWCMLARCAQTDQAIHTISSMATFSPSSSSTKVLIAKTTNFCLRFLKQGHFELHRTRSSHWGQGELTGTIIIQTERKGIFHTKPVMWMMLLLLLLLLLLLQMEKGETKCLPPKSLYRLN